ncbi:MAG: DMT family transporter [Planctomycetota bacterium]|jgi:drug/metabolite transporter (DMT)-like permease
MKEQKKAYIFGLLAVLFWSTIGSAFKISLRHSNVMSLLLVASLTSTSVIFCCLIFSRKFHYLRQSTPKDYLHSAVLGLINPFIYYIVLLKAYDILPAQEALALNFTWPIMLVLFSILLLNQKISSRSILAMLISFAGVIVIATRGKVFGFKPTNIPGVSLALASSIIWALFWIYNLKDKRDEIAKLFLNFAFGTCYIFAAAILTGSIGLNNTKTILGGIYIGIFEMGITFVFWLNVYLIPFVSVTLIGLVVGETIYTYTIIGLILIVAGIILQKKANN